jgi:hypothetical protein
MYLSRLLMAREAALTFIQRLAVVDPFPQATCGKIA